MSESITDEKLSQGERSMNTNKLMYKAQFAIFGLVIVLVVLIWFFSLTTSAYGRTIYFQSNAEVGDLSEWVGDGGGGIYYWSDKNGALANPLSLWTEGVHATQEVAHSGNYSIKCYLADPSVANHAKLMRWRIDKKEAYYSAWYYFDRAFTSKQGVNIMQWKTLPLYGSCDPTFVIECVTVDGIRHVRLYHWPEKRMYFQSVWTPIPPNVWTHIETYYKIDKINGEVIIWQNGKEIIRVTGVNTQKSIVSSEYLMFGVGNYASTTDIKNLLLYIDDAMVTDFRVSDYIPPSPPKNLKLVPSN
jgi:hypothetical protein